ncbi:hypothetical protein AAFF_G00038680 [Aldrovandia affinis]|uniref:Uncharacterized protein n=1 Tax=Aldrovandia affinis TaxID=143900 RepID=A0AAD7T6W5_9TELE|nr:hypothetical protein AAFF_G00038680 [Aldrovandia affinis]
MRPGATFDAVLRLRLVQPASRDPFMTPATAACICGQSWHMLLWLPAALVFVVILANVFHLQQVLLSLQLAVSFGASNSEALGHVLALPCCRWVDIPAPLRPESGAHAKSGT